jgi:hypothetical protein
MRSFSATGQDGVARVLVVAAVFAAVLIAAVLVSGVPSTTPARPGAAVMPSNSSVSVTGSTLTSSTATTIVSAANQNGLATITGKVSIVLCPEPAVVNPSSCQTPSTMYSTRQLVLASPTFVANILLNPDGTFTAQVPPGTYQVSISKCDFLGCDRSTPSSISIVTTPSSSFSICFNCAPT